MTKKDLLKRLEPMPDDAVLMAYDPDSEQMEPISGLLHGPANAPVEHSDGVIPEGTYVIELCTDEP